MPRTVKNPRYNVLSFRVSDEELKLIEPAMSGNRQDFLRAAAMFAAGLKKGQTELERVSR